MSTQVCNMDCLNCIYDDCINDGDMTLEEREFSKEYETSLRKDQEPKIIPELGMQRYIRNRPDKEAYIKARNAEYEAKRKGREDRKECKRQQYLRHREEKINYSRSYYKDNKDEILAQQKAKYHANKDEINAKRREAYEKNKDEINRKRREKARKKREEQHNASNKE